MRRIGVLSLLAVGVALVAALALAGCSGTSGAGRDDGGGYGGGSSAPPPSDTSSKVTVTEKGFAFTPAEVKVKVGETVTFVNEDSAPHQVSIDGTDLGNQNTGDSVTWTAKAAGSFPYVCTIHPAMTGTVVVE